MESNAKIESRYTLGFRAFIIIFWVGISVYIAIDFPEFWNDENINKIGLTIIGIPSIIILISGIVSFQLTRISLTDEYIEEKVLLTKRIDFPKLKRVELGPHFLELHSEDNKKVVVSWLHENYSEIRTLLIDKANSMNDVTITYRKRYRKLW